MRQEQHEYKRVHHLLQTWADIRPESLALRDVNVQLTYRGLEHQSQLMSECLINLGVRPGDRVVLIGENCVALCVLFLAVIRLDAWAVVLNARLSPREIHEFLQHSGARRTFYLSQESADAQAHAIRDHATTMETDFGKIQVGQLNAAAVPEGVRDSADQQVAALVYTSGTTGVPKGVMLSHANLMFIASSARDLRHLKPGDVLYGVLPMAHVVGLSTQFLGCISAGATLLLAPKFSADQAANAMATQGVTVFTGVPALFARLLEWSRKTGQKIEAPHLRLISTAGAPLTASLKRDVELAFKLPLHNGYGLTETSPTIAQTRIDAPREDCSVGPPIPGVEVRVVAEDGTTVGQGQTGELWVKSPGVMQGYYRNETLTAQVLNHQGWFKTGDLAFIGYDDAISLAGRSKELIIRSGFNVYPLEVEQVLNAYEGVVQSAVVGREVDHNEEVVAFLEIRVGMIIDNKHLQSYLRDHLSPYKLPSEIRVLDALPSAPNGKVLKHVLKELAKSEH